MKPSIANLHLSFIAQPGKPRGKPTAAIFAFVFAIAAGCSSAEPLKNNSAGGQGGDGGDGGSGGTSGTGGKGGSGGGAGGTSGSGGKGGSGAGGSSGSGGGAGGTSGSGGGGAGGTAGSSPDAGPDTGMGGMGGTGGDGGAGAGGAGGATSACSTMPGTVPTLKRTQIGMVPQQPGQAVAVPGEDILYVMGHKNGAIYILEKGKMTPSGNLATVNVAAGGNDEQGLLSMAFHPEFATNKLFYVFYTAATGGRITVDEFERLTPTTSMKKGTIWDKARTGGGAFHNGGSIYFSPKDTKPILYHSVGNNASNEAGSPMGDSGRILFHDLSTKTSGTWAYGLRNPYRMSIDRLSGDMYIGEVSNGQGGSILGNPSGKKGTDFGYRNNNAAEISGGISGRDSSSGAIIGGVVYRGKAIPEICGRYFFGMWRSGAIKSFPVQGGQRMGNVATHADITVSGLSSFGEDGAGEIIMSSQQGGVYRLEK